MPKYVIPILIVIASIGILTTGRYFLGEEEIRVVSLLEGRTRSQHEAYSKKLMIATQGDATTKAGIEIHKAGGNIYDVAATISFMIAVERPQSTGLGGGGFLIHKKAGIDAAEAIDFREVAPLSSHSKIFQDKDGNVQRNKSLDGALAAGVPGTVAGILEMHQKYGKLKRQEIIAPAIKLAREGFKVYPHLEFSINYRKDVLKRFSGSRDLFFNEKTGEPLKTGDLFIQEDLAQVLEEISEKGKDGFYKGWVAKKIAGEFKKRGGLITLKDLESYEVKWRDPIVGSYRGYEIISMPPPSSGGAHVIQILNMLEDYDLKSLGAQSAESTHLLASAFQLAYIDRARYLGDTDFINVPLRQITSKSYAKKLREKIIREKAISIDFEDLENHINPVESSQTTHFSIMDEEGNVIVSTQTINGFLGSGMVIPGTGVLMNNEMDDFTAKLNSSNLFGAVGGKNNLISPRKRPLSSMSPTIVLKHHEPIFAVGSPGGTRIITCVVQAILNYFDFGLPLYESIASTRIHHQWKPNVLGVKPPGLTDGNIKKLEKWGHKIDYDPLTFCYTQAVTKEEKGLHGVSDPRGKGTASGY